MSLTSHNVTARQVADTLAALNNMPGTSFDVEKREHGNTVLFTGQRGFEHYVNVTTYEGATEPTLTMVRRTRGGNKDYTSYGLPLTREDAKKIVATVKRAYQAYLVRVAANDAYLAAGRAEAR